MGPAMISSITTHVIVTLATPTIIVKQGAKNQIRKHWCESQAFLPKNWYGDVLDINECESVICQNGGTCEEGIDVWECICVAGYTGSNCETGRTIF